MQDFLGNEFRAGGFVAAGGTGNGAAEYGMILFRVDKVGTNLKLTRLRADYPTFKADATVIVPSQVTATNPNRYVVVHPSEEVKELFLRAIAGGITQAEANKLGLWIHGASRQPNPF